jgi:hypothetical protein
MSLWTDIFHSTAKENWKILANEVGGKFIDGGLLKTNKVEFKYRHTIITLDTLSRGGKNSKTFTRILCPFIATNGLNFTITLEDVFTNMLKFFGIKDIEIGNIDFDHEIYLKSNQKATFLKFLDSETLQEKLILAFENSDLVMQVNDDHPFFILQTIPSKMVWLKFEHIGLEDNIHVLKSWFNLCKITLDRLIEIGEAEDISPDIQ